MPTADERLRVVLDTNVLVSGLNFAGTPSRLLRLLLQGEMDWFVSPFILGELRHILLGKFRWDEKRVDRALRLIRAAAVEVDPPRTVSVIQEKDDDNRVLECAVHGKAHYLVTGDRHHILPLREFHGVSIVTTAEFMEKLLRVRGES